MARPRLHICRDLAVDYLAAIEFGSTSDGRPEHAWRVVRDRVGFLYEQDRCIGIQVNGFSSFDPQEPEFEALWGDEWPRFDVPQLGLRNATAGEICVAARAFLGDEPSLDSAYFSAAVSAGADDDWEEAARLWRLALEAGSPLAHYGLGYTLYELGDAHGAYRHLRAYAEIAPTSTWAWCWLGRVCLLLNEQGEARAAFEKAIELEEDGGEETDAAELIEELAG